MLRWRSMRCSRSFGRRAVAEHAVEHDARIDFHRHRCRRRTPGNRVHVGAAEADVAGSDQSAVILDRQFQRRQQRFLSDLAGRHLIDRHAGEDIRAVGSLGMNAIQEHRRATGMVAAVVARSLRAGHRVSQIADHDHLILVGSSGARIGESFSAPSSAGVQFAITAP